MASSVYSIKGLNAVSVVRQIRNPLAVVKIIMLFSTDVHVSESL